LIAIREALAALKEIATESGSDLEKPVARMERSIERCERMSSDLLEYTSARELQPTSFALINGSARCSPGSVSPGR
jgi:hypothetical protein